MRERGSDKRLPAARRRERRGIRDAGRGHGAFTGNPAAGRLLLRDNRSVRLGILTLPNLAYEFGPIDNFVHDIESLEDRLDQQDLVQAEAQAIIDEFQPVLVEIGDNAYVNLDAQQQLPFTPTVFRAFGGVMTLDIGTTW